MRLPAEFALMTLASVQDRQSDQGKTQDAIAHILASLKVNAHGPDRTWRHHPEELPEETPEVTTGLD